MKRVSLFYCLTLLITGAAILGVLHLGSSLTGPVVEGEAPAAVTIIPAPYAAPVIVIVLVATVGKLGGSAVTARFTGMSWRDALQLGALMNTRGLMELTTTALTGPLLSLFGEKQPAVNHLPGSAPA